MIRDKDEPLYVIGVVARMLRVHPQTLRMYEREGLISPVRAGGQRLYSESEIERLDMILSLTRNMGVNRAGVDIILRMRQRLEQLQEEVEDMMQLLDEEIRHEFHERIRKIFLEEEEG
jgi:MerR family transcriptional regulator/heat shock protein HspR